MKSSYISAVAGGSAGHIIPALVVVQKYQKQNPGTKIMFFSSSRSIDVKVIGDQNINLYLVKLAVDRIPSKNLKSFFLFSFNFVFSFFKSFLVFCFRRPKKLITTGGLVAFPVCFAAKFLFIPIELYELNVVPGKASKYISFLATQVFLVFEKCRRGFSQSNFVQKKCQIISYPLRFEESDLTFEKDSLIQKINKKYRVSFKATNKTVFILGGSQGSKFLSEIFKSWFLENSKNCSRLQIIHQLCEDELEDFKNFYCNHQIENIVFSYEQNLNDFYLISDLVLSRAGAGTLFELNFFGKKSLIVPLKTKTTDHQIDNASELASMRPELFTLILQENYEQILGKISDFLF